MLKIEHEILSYIRDNSGCLWIDVINRFDPQSSCRIIDGLLDSLLDAQLITASGNERQFRIVKLTSIAWHELALYQQTQEEDEAKRRQRRNDQFVTAAISIASTVVGAALGNIHLLF